MEPEYKGKLYHGQEFTATRKAFQRILKAAKAQGFEVRMIEVRDGKVYDIFIVDPKVTK